MSLKKSFRSGFTLIELSIVLVVIAIIIAGILAGQEVINSAKVNSVVTDISKYERFVNTFKLKYDKLPGDMPTATDYWAGAHNGDGDSKITGITTVAESFGVWEHMGLAKITPPYTWADSALTAGAAGTNFPKSTYCSKCGYSIFSEEIDSVTGWTIGAGNDYPHEPAMSVNRLVVGWETTTLPTGPLMTGMRAKQADMKMDDGVASSGRLLGGNGYYPGYPALTGCTSATPAVYVATDTDVKCILIYTLDVDDQ